MSDRAGHGGPGRPLLFEITAHERSDPAPHTILHGNESTAPNIRICIADDQSWPRASACGDAVVRTSAFDRIAREGVLFHHACSAAPS